jgi:hypothetical protein
VSVANQSMLTEGVGGEQQQKSVYAMDFAGFNQLFQDIQKKANECEFNSYNAQYLKRWKMVNEISWDNSQSLMQHLVREKTASEAGSKGSAGSGFKFPSPPANPNKHLSQWDYAN